MKRDPNSHDLFPDFKPSTKPQPTRTEGVLTCWRKSKGIECEGVVEPVTGESGKVAGGQCTKCGGWLQRCFGCGGWFVSIVLHLWPVDGSRTKCAEHPDNQCHRAQVVLRERGPMHSAPKDGS